MRLCLNMIVKNESAILERCLLSVRPYLSCYVICDTGSSDETIEIIRDSLVDLPGQVHEIPFLNFEQARNQALELARTSDLEFDYLLFIDADMELVVSESKFPAKLSYASYLVRQVSQSMAYHNVRLLRRDVPARYVGATHEYLNLSDPARRLEGAHMLDHACGSSRAEKTTRDLALLQSALEANPQDGRALFYFAQTLREAGRFRDAIAAYRARVDLGGWEEEVWYSRFMIARCYEALGKFSEFVANCLEAYQTRPVRSEPLYALAQHYRKRGEYETSALFCEAGLQIAQPDDLLFLEQHAYSTGFRHELSIAGFYCQNQERKAAGRRYASELALERDVSSEIRYNVRSNWRFYALSVPELFSTARFTRLEHPVPEGFAACNPSLAVWKGALWCALRTVNYKIDGNGYLTCDDDIVRSASYLLTLGENFEVVFSVPTLESQPRPEHPFIDGLEDVRLIPCGDLMRGSATIAGEAPDYRRQTVIFDLHQDGTITDLSVQEYGSDQHQKNWVPFVDRKTLGFIHWTDPTTILRWDEDSRQAKPWHQHACPKALEHQRGGSGAIAFDGGWLYVTHEVTEAPHGRTYLHRFIWLDEQFRVQALTEPFYFRSVGIEFCCGLVAGPVEGQLLLSFGINDAEAWLVTLEADQVRGQLVRLG